MRAQTARPPLDVGLEVPFLLLEMLRPQEQALGPHDAIVL
jgi:hypothetical protein